MTREDEIKKQAEIYTDNRDNYVEWSDGWEAHNDIKFVEKAFIEGAKWAYNNINISSIWNDVNIDWLLSGDDGEESFHKRLKEELDNLKNKKNESTRTN